MTNNYKVKFLDASKQTLIWPNFFTFGQLLVWIELKYVMTRYDIETRRALSNVRTYLITLLVNI